MDSSCNTDVPTGMPLLEATFPVILSKATQERLACRADHDVYKLEPLKLMHIDTIRKDLTLRGDSSDFAPLQKEIKMCGSSEILLIFDHTRAHGSEFLLCLSEDSKFGYLQSAEESLMKLVDINEVNTNSQLIEIPRPWNTLGSNNEIEGTWVKDLRPRIRLQVRRSVRRQCPLFTFSDRDVDDVKDGYISCDPYEAVTPMVNVSLMDRGVQAVPTVVEGEAQTELKHPKNVDMQYEARVFNPEEVAELWKSPEMRKFLHNVEKIMEEVSKEPDIMGEFRPEVESFYRRDEVVVIEETQFVHRAFFSDLVFTRNMRATEIRWHPVIPDIVAMSVMENSTFEEYLDNVSQRLAMPNVLTIWSMKFPFFPQLLLRVCDDITHFEWHPNEPEILVGGCVNGQLQIWDIGDYLDQLSSGVCTWDHQVFLNSQMDKLHLEQGFIPLLNWSAESDRENSHLCRVEDLQWLPQNVWFSYDSAYPKRNQHGSELQLISCDGDSNVFIWALRKPPSDSMSLEQDVMAQESESAAAAGASAAGADQAKGFRSDAWEKLKVQSAISGSSKKKKKYKPAIGKYEGLNQVWRPVHRICFLDSRFKHEEKLLQVVITSLNVIDRPDLIQAFARKRSVAPVSIKEALSSSAAGPPHQSVAAEAQEESKVVNETAEKKKEDNPALKDESPRPRDEGDADDELDDDDDDDEIAREDPAQYALPTFLMAGTIYGAIIRVDLTKVKVDVETNNLICKVDWEVSIHDGPVSKMVRSPMHRHLLLTMGGYSWAIWNESDMASPVVLHYVEDALFTDVAWSLAQPHVLFFSDELGRLQAWDIKSRKAEPFHIQDISGKPLTAICPYARQDMGQDSDSGSQVGHFLSVADACGTLHVLYLPKHLYERSEFDNDDLLDYIELQIGKLVERKRLQTQREEEQGQPPKKSESEEFEAERHIDWPEDDYLMTYFKREKHILWNIYGDDWKTHLRHPSLPRKKYYVEETRRDSSEERRRQQAIQVKAKKKKGGSIFRKYTD